MTIFLQNEDIQKIESPTYSLGLKYNGICVLHTKTLTYFIQAPYELQGCDLSSGFVNILYIEISRQFNIQHEKLL